MLGVLAKRRWPLGSPFEEQSAQRRGRRVGGANAVRPPGPSEAGAAPDSTALSRKWTRRGAQEGHARAVTVGGCAPLPGPVLTGSWVGAPGSPGGAWRRRDCPAAGSGWAARPTRRQRLSGQRKYRSWTAQQKLEIVLAGLRGDRSVREVCREHAISETLYYLEAARERLGGKQERQGERELRRKVAELERALGRKTHELEIAGEALRMP